MTWVGGICRQSILPMRGGPASRADGSAVVACIWVMTLRPHWERLFLWGGERRPPARNAKRSNIPTADRRAGIPAISCGFCHEGKSRIVTAAVKLPPFRAATNWCCLLQMEVVSLQNCALDKIC
jgi:hypothetical protein